MRHFEELKIWQKAMTVTEYCYKITEKFPIEEKYGLISQIRRSAISIPSNISEGAGRNTDGEFRQFLGMANGSTFELLTQLYLSKRLNIISEESIRPIINEALEVIKMNYSLQKTLQKS